VWRVCGEYHREPVGDRQRLLADGPKPVRDERWDAPFAGLAGQLVTRDRQDAPCSAALPWFSHRIPGGLPVIDLTPLASTAGQAR
jgi:hypothetical protein